MPGSPSSGYHFGNPTRVISLIWVIGNLGCSRPYEHIPNEEGRRTPEPRLAVEQWSAPPSAPENQRDFPASASIAVKTESVRTIAMGRHDLLGLTRIRSCRSILTARVRQSSPKPDSAISKGFPTPIPRQSLSAYVVSQ